MKGTSPLIEETEAWAEWPLITSLWPGLYRNFETDLQVTEMKVCGGATDAAECVDIFVETW